MAILLLTLVVVCVSTQALTALALTDQQAGQCGGWPSLRFRFNIKRNSMKVHGQSDFNVLASPRLTSDGHSIIYDTFATFTEGSTSYNYTVVDGISYTSRSLLKDGNFAAPSVKCSDSEVTPSINTIVSALNEAVVVSSVSTNNGSLIKCSRGNSFQVAVNGINFGLCVSGSTGFAMYGNDMDIDVEYEQNPEEIEAPSTEEKCEAAASSIKVNQVGKSLLTGGAIPSQSARKLEAAFDFGFSLGDDSCSCKSTPRPCVFLHGLGVLTEKADNLKVDPYWGDLTDHAPCCSSMEYAMLNTVNNSWTDPIQQQKVCDHLLAANQANQDSTIADTIVVTHSMGGLLVAGALASGKCRLAASSSWVATAAPMRGSMASDYFQESCKDNTSFAMEVFVDQTGLCPADDGVQSLAYEGEGYSTKELNEAYKSAQEAYRTHVTAALCSNANSGLSSAFQAAFWVLGSTVNHKSPENDGMVEFYSCAGGFPESKFGNTYNDRFYVTKLNHADAAFRYGDALLDEAKMPLKWFECLL